MRDRPQYLDGMAMGEAGVEAQIAMASCLQRLLEMWQMMSWLIR